MKSAIAECALLLMACCETSARRPSRERSASSTAAGCGPDRRRPGRSPEGTGRIYQIDGRSAADFCRTVSPGNQQRTPSRRRSKCTSLLANAGEKIDGVPYRC
jgi:hypothetical protein